MTRRLFGLLILAGLLTPIAGCEVTPDGDIDDGELTVRVIE